MLQRAGRRCVVSLPPAPWIWRQRASPIRLSPIPKADERLFTALLKDTFVETVGQLVNALSAVDSEWLQANLEGKLAQQTIEQLQEMKQQGYSLHVTDPAPRLKGLYNFKVHMGVHLQRSRNVLAAGTQVRILNIKALQGMLDEDYLNKLIGSSDPSEKLDLKKLENVWIYMYDRSPSKIVYSVDTVFKGNHPLTLKKEEKDLIYTQDFEEMHVVRFETEGKDIDPNNESEASGVPPSLLSVTSDTLDPQSWRISGIDHTIRSNPFISIKSS